MTALTYSTVTWILAGPIGLVVACLIVVISRIAAGRRVAPATRPVLIMLLVELRSGLSVLAALQNISRRFRTDPELQRAVAVATVSGLHSAIAVTEGRLRILMIQLSRAQVTGSSAAEAVSNLLDADLARERTSHLARIRALPVRLMVPMTLLILPGVVFLGYGPTLLSLLHDVVMPFG